MKHIPNLFTLLNLLCGCVAIICILQTGETLVTTDEEGAWVPQLPERITWGALFIGAAAIIDFLDGFAARLFRAYSEIGRQLDSLADVVSFGVAPSLILYQMLRISYISGASGLDTPVWALAPALLFVCAGAWRLARFNRDNTGPGDFKGLPIPAAGLLVASLPLIVFYHYFNFVTLLTNSWVLYGLIALLSWLMVSKARFIAIKFSDSSLKNNAPALILGVATVVAAIFLQWLAIPVVFIMYIIISLTTKKQLE